MYSLLIFKPSFIGQALEFSGSFPAVQIHSRTCGFPKVIVVVQEVGSPTQHLLKDTQHKAPHEHCSQQAVHTTLQSRQRHSHKNKSFLFFFFNIPLQKHLSNILNRMSSSRAQGMSAGSWLQGLPCCAPELLLLLWVQDVLAPCPGRADLALPVSGCHLLVCNV